MTDSNDDYIPLNQDKNIAIKKKKNNLGKWCCMITLLSIISTFFLVPRKPYIYLDTIYIGANNNSYGKFELRNNNFYDIKWSNPDITLYWLPYKGQTVGEICYGNDDPCESGKFFKGSCAIKLGEFKSNDKFKTKLKSTNKISIPMTTSSPKEIACTSWMLLNPYKGMLQRLVTKGHISSKSDIYYFGKVKVTDGYYYI